MLWVYASLDLQSALKKALEDLPESHINLSKVRSSELATAIQDVCDHHAAAHIFLGYLDPLLMVHPMDEARMRRGFAKCTISVVVSNPFLLPLSWKNGTGKLYILKTAHANDTQAIHDGGSSQVRPNAGHGQAAPSASNQRKADQGRKKGGAAKGRKQAGQDQAA